MPTSLVCHNKLSVIQEESTFGFAARTPGEAPLARMEDPRYDFRPLVG